MGLDLRRITASASRGAAAVVARPWIWMSLLGFSALGLGIMTGSWRNLCADCPSIAQVYGWEPTQTSKVYAQNGELIAQLGAERRTPVSIEDLPPHVRYAFVAVEDKRFYQHEGLDYFGIARAVVGVATGTSGRRGGGSTITQQLARNMFPANIGFERRLVRKLKEAQVAMQLEAAYSKDQILEAYINQVNYGQGWYGIQTAARNYFGKDASELDPTEAAMLAGIPNLPSYYTPLKYPENATRRRNLVLRRMADQGYLPREELEARQAEPVPTERADVDEGVSPYFVEWVRSQLDDRYGDRLYTAGLEVYTTLNVDMQRSANRAMEAGWDAIEARPGFPHPLYSVYADSTSLSMGESPYVQGAFIAMDPATGAVRALIGGRDFRHSKFNRATQAHRQAGSSFKPFVYASALASGVPASHVIVDAPVVIPQPDGTEWRPQNYTSDFSGPMTIREGLRRSINMIAIKLGIEIGLETVAQTARRMGISTEVERFESTAIGAAEVIPIEMLEAYSTFSTLGTKAQPFGILKIVTADGEVLFEQSPQTAAALDERVARIMVSILEEVVNRGTATAIRTTAGLPYDVRAGGKTGTTNNSTDTWFVGFTPNLVALVWFGMDLPQQIYQNATGGGAAAPVWGRFARDVYYGSTEEDSDRAVEPMLPIPDPWPLDQGLTSRQVDSKTGTLASRWCPEEDIYTEIFIPGTEPTEVCDRQSGIRLFGRGRVP